MAISRPEPGAGLMNKQRRADQSGAWGGILGFFTQVTSDQVILLLPVNLSVRLGLDPLIVTHGHISAWKKISVLSFVGRPP